MMDMELIEMLHKALEKIPEDKRSEVLERIINEAAIEAEKMQQGSGGDET